MEPVEGLCREVDKKEILRCYSFGVESNTTGAYIILFNFTRCRLEGTTCFGLPYRPSSGHKIYPRKLYTKYCWIYSILYSWFRESWPCINKIQRDATVCSCLFTAKLLYKFRVSIAPIIRSTSNCNCSFWYRSYHMSQQQPSASEAKLAEGCCCNKWCDL